MGESTSHQVFFEIEGLISDALQVISYKWLSRKFSIPSNIAKRLLERFVTQNPQLDLEIVYALSGWTKTEPQCYSIQLVPKSKLEGAKATLMDSPSVHVYSVQRSLPKDPAQLWSADFIQAVELFNEPQDVSNCLRDNRFSAVACGVVHRSLSKKTSGPTSSLETLAAVSKPPTGLHTDSPRPVQPSLPPKNLGADIKPVKREIAASSPAGTNQISKDVSGDIKPVKNEMLSSSPGSESIANGLKVNLLSPGAGKRKAIASVTPAGGSRGGSISNLWGKAAGKPKVPSPPKLSEPPAPVATGGDAEAMIQAIEEDVYSDEDVELYASSRAKRTTGRRRMIVEDDDSGNDEAELGEEMIVRLVTPDSPEDVKLQLDNGHAIATISRNEGSEVKPKPSIPESKISSNVLEDKNSVAGNLQPAKVVEKEEEEVQKSSAAAQEAPGIRSGAKRKKVLQTRMDEKGREVTEVVWMKEGEEMVPNDNKPQHDTTKPAAPTNKERDSKASTERPRALPKPQAGPSKAPPTKGGKNVGKSGGKQQGSIMSFFKKQ